MAMSAGFSANGEPMSEMNTTPLIDVLLVLLVTFIMTLPVMSNVTKLDLQGGGTGMKREVINVEVDFDGTVVWNGTTASNLEQLESWARTEARKTLQPELHVRADRRAPYDSVAKVMAIAQRNGLERIGIVGE